MIIYSSIAVRLVKYYRNSEFHCFTYLSHKQFAPDTFLFTEINKLTKPKPIDGVIYWILSMRPDGFSMVANGSCCYDEEYDP